VFVKNVEVAVFVNITDEEDYAKNAEVPEYVNITEKEDPVKFAIQMDI
jgi:hypothetical protein